MAIYKVVCKTKGRTILTTQNKQKAYNRAGFHRRRSGHYVLVYHLPDTFLRRITGKELMANVNDSINLILNTEEE